MKTTTTIIKTVVLSAIVLSAELIFAQQATEKQEQQKYQIKIVKDENGKQEVIDKTFTSKDELDAYMKDNNLDAPEITEDLLPPLPPLPPVPPCHGKSAKDCDKDMKTITVTENAPAAGNGPSSLQITYENFAPEERAELINEVLSQKEENVRVEIRKERTLHHEINSETQTPVPPQPPMSVKEPLSSANNLNDVKVFPNPSGGQFHVEFSVSKPSTVQVKLTDLNGKEVYNETFNNYSGKFEKDISNTNLAGGTYIMEINAGGEKTTTKVVMQ